MHVCMRVYITYVACSELRLNHLDLQSDEDEESDLEMMDTAPVPTRMLPPGPQHPGFMPLRVFRLLATIASASRLDVYVWTAVL